MIRRSDSSDAQTSDTAPGDTAPGGARPRRHELVFPFDVTLIRSAMRRHFAWKVVVVVALVLAVAAGWQVVLRSFDPLFSGGAVLVAALLAGRMVQLFRRAAQRSFELWRKQSPSGTLTFRLDDEGFDVVMDHARARYAWRGLRRLWRHPDVWILEIVKDTSVFFPPGRAPEELRAFVLERCRDAGVRT